MATLEHRPVAYVSVSADNDAFLRYPWPRNTWPDPHHQPAHPDEIMLLRDAVTVPGEKYIALRLMHSDGSWPAGQGCVTTIRLERDIMFDLLYRAALYLFKSLCKHAFEDISLVNFDVARMEDQRLLCFSGPDWRRLVPAFDAFEDRSTHLLHALPKYVHFVRDTQPDKNIILKIKMHDREPQIVAKLVEGLGFDAGDDIYARFGGNNVPLSWLTLPHNPHERDLLTMDVVIAKRTVESVAFSYILSGVQTTWTNLKFVYENRFAADKKSNEEYYARIQHYWSDLCPEMAMFLPRQATHAGQYSIMSKYGVTGGKYRRVGEPCANREEDLKPFSEWPQYFKHCLAILAQMTPGARPVAIAILYWCVHIRKCQATDNMKNVCEALPKDVKEAIKFFESLDEVDNAGRSGIDKWNKAAVEERIGFTAKGSRAHEKLNELDLFEQKAEITSQLETNRQEIAAAKDELKMSRRQKPPSQATVHMLVEKIEGLQSEKKDLDEDNRNMKKQWEDAPKLTSTEIFDVLMFEYCAFHRQRSKESDENAAAVDAELNRERQRMAQLCLL